VPPPTTSRRARWLFALIATVTSLIVSLVTAEISLRLAGYTPWQYRDVQNAPPMLRSDPKLGWRQKAGTYFFPGDEQKAGYRVTLNEDGSRRTAESQHDGPEVLFVGCSFTQGWGLADESTHPWLLQERFPELHVVNFGTPGYGTYQSLLRLEAELLTERSPRLVVYGFIKHHETRNAATVSWLKSVAVGSTRGHAALPYARLGASGRLLRHRPARYPVFTASEWSALAALVQDAYAEAVLHRRTDSRQLTRRLMVEMDERARNAGSKFMVVILAADESTREDYKKYLDGQGIRAVNCVLSDSDLLTRRRGHPNEEANRIWADCIEKSFRQPF
jgi:hypothetical protein